MSGAANENWPIVKLRPVGESSALARVLVRVLVRRALIVEGIIPQCENHAKAG